MKNSLILAVLFLSACSKNFDKPAVLKISKEPERCDFGISQFNKHKRAPVTVGANKRPPKLPPSGSPGAVILLDFDGYVVSGTSWNYNGDISCAPANLTAEESNEIVDRVSNDYSPFNVTITTSQSVYDAANPQKRMRVVITETYEWFGVAGGVALMGSFTWGNNTPCFVFSSLFSYNLKSISEAASHEAGHTLGLFHQSTYDANCINTSEYNYGQGSGELGWAPIMGSGLYQNVTLWHNGFNSESCSSVQNEVAIISNVVGGMKSDDYSNTKVNSKTLTVSEDGLINNMTDVDFFYIDINSTKNILLTPFSMGPNNAGANLDLLLKIYSSNGALISVVDNPAGLNVTAILSPGKYYLAVTTTPNQFAGTYGMLGYYNIGLI